jgi:hypothetical protein
VCWGDLLEEFSEGARHGSGKLPQLPNLSSLFDRRPDFESSMHPLSDTHLVLLLQSHKILLVDILTAQITEIPLDDTTDYISFTFGPCVDWMRLCPLEPSLTSVRSSRPAPSSRPTPSMNSSNGLLKRD